MTRADDIDALVARWFQTEGPPSEGLPLAVAPFGPEEIAEAIDALLSGWLTMGPRVRAFETAWAQQVGCEHAVAVNSGSSALLVLLCGLVEVGILEPGQEVVVPAVAWSTSLTSVARAGLTPVLVDVAAETLCLEGTFEQPVLAVHLLGCPSRARSPVVIEDACAAHGARVGERAVGSLGVGGAFSFFFSHHLTTGEGGLITTSDEALANACRSMRAHGWIRERSDRDELAARYPSVDPRFLFVSAGFNLRPTELMGAFGIHQVERLESYVATRNNNHRTWCTHLDSLGLPIKVFPEAAGTTHAGFAFPLLLESDAPVSRAELCGRLERQGIHTRPISGSNLARQPFFENIPGARVQGLLPVADAVHERGLFVGQSHAFGEEHLDRLARALAVALDA
ncbi:MAG: DegT/DnrJ/EryC1/StrS family aminotransferase [Myxococcota bacterium]|nr:DegT/DnrJ/EryC1/StrS family aminotransferase [Myxococcota bacterium]